MNVFNRNKSVPLSAVLEQAQSFSAQGRTAAPTTRLLLTQIDANPDQPRRYFDPHALQELADSITVQGVLQPIMVRPVADRFEIVFGERRFRASLLAGATDIPALIHDVSDEDIPVIAAVENLQRANLNRLEEVQAKLNLIARVLNLDVSLVPDHLKAMRAQPTSYPDDVQSVHELFQQLGGEQWTSFISNGLPVLRLPEPVRGAVERGELAYSKALLIARTPSEHHAALVDQTVAQHWSERDLKQQIRTLVSPAPTTDHTAGLKSRLSVRRVEKLPPETRREAERLIEALYKLLS